MKRFELTFRARGHRFQTIVNASDENQAKELVQAATAAKVYFVRVAETTR